MTYVRPVLARVDVLGRGDRGKFVRTGSVFLLGEEGCKHVKTAADVSLENRALVDAIGERAVRVIARDAATTEGGGAEKDDWDDQDFEALLREEDPADASAAGDAGTASVSGDSFEPLVLQSRDKMEDVCEVVAVATGIDPFKQYIWAPDLHRPLAAGVSEVSLMEHWRSSLRRVEAFPVDLYPSTLESAPLDAPAVVLAVLSLDTVFDEAARSRLRFVARSDPTTYEIIHAGAVAPFFPLASVAVFQQELANPAEVKTAFPQLAWNRARLLAQFRERARLLSELERTKFSAEANGVLVSVLSLTMASIAPPGLGDRVDTMRIFQSVDINDHPEVSTIDVFGPLDGAQRSGARLRKVRQSDHVRLAQKVSGSAGVSKLYSTRQLNWERALMFTLLPRSERSAYSSMIVVITRLGKCWIKASAAQSTSSLNELRAACAASASKLLGRLNAINSAFATTFRFPVVGSNRNNGNDDDNDDGGQFRVRASTSKLTFSKLLSFGAFVDIIEKTLAAAGLVSGGEHAAGTAADPAPDTSAPGSTFALSYGVTRSLASGGADRGGPPAIQLEDVNGVASLSLIDLDLLETDLYAHLLARVACLFDAVLTESVASAKKALGVVDPMLYRARRGQSSYARICQKRFQPEVAARGDPGAVEYHNFTFGRPEFYRCPDPALPHLGLLIDASGRGQPCQPCCRKTAQRNVDTVRRACVGQQDGDDQASAAAANARKRKSTYTNQYPSADVSNAKLASRQFELPNYVLELLGGAPLVMNVLLTPAPGTPEDNLTLRLIAQADAIPGDRRPRYATVRDLILELVAFVEQPQQHSRIMRNQLVADRFTAPAELAHALKDKYLRNAVLQHGASRLADSEWNDLVVFLANCTALNVLLLSDSREPERGLLITNLRDIDPARPVLVLVRRVDLRSAHTLHQTRALYIPVTAASFRRARGARAAQQSLPRLNLSAALAKLKRLVMGPREAVLNKRLSLDTCEQFCSRSKGAYSVGAVLAQGKLLRVDVSGSPAQKPAAGAPPSSLFLSAVAVFGSFTDTHDASSVSARSPTASFEDALAFVSEYNKSAFKAARVSSDQRLAYLQYLRLATRQDSTTQIGRAHV